MLQYRLDKDTALALASAVEIDNTVQEQTFIIEHMTKVQDVEAAPNENEQYSSP